MLHDELNSAQRNLQNPTHQQHSSFQLQLFATPMGRKTFFIVLLATLALAASALAFGSGLPFTAGAILATSGLFAAGLYFSSKNEPKREHALNP
jgi:hypothetical protein